MQERPGRLRVIGLLSFSAKFFMFIFLFLGKQALGDSAETLPKGVFNFTVNPQFYLPVDRKYGPDGQVEELGKDFNAVLNSNVFPSLALIEKYLGLPSGYANIGRSVVSISRDFTVIDFYASYGITERLSVGLKIPYWFVKNNVDAKLDTSGATVGKNATLNSLVPLRIPGTVPLTTQDVKDLLGAGLDINQDGTIDIKGYGYEKFGSKSQNGLSDIEGGFKYQYLNAKNWRLAAYLGGRFPVGDVDATDDLVDYGFGTGAWGLTFALNNDYTGIKNLILDFTFRYKALFPDSQTLRVPRDVNEPITGNKEDVDRDPGDVFEFETGASYNFAKCWAASLLYKYAFSLKDSVSGRAGVDFSALEDETDYAEHVGIVGLSYSTIPLYQAKQFPVPITAGIAYRNRFAGRNTYKSQYIGINLSVFF